MQTFSVSARRTLRDGFVFAVLMWGGIGPSWAATVRTVNSVADTTDGICDVASCTLREAMTVAQPDDTIAFSNLFNAPQTINLTGVLPDISANLTITGPGADRLTVRRSTGGDYRIFLVAAGSATISGLTISNGKSGFAGGILVHGSLTLNDAAVTGNESAIGGGVYLDGAGMLIQRTTISGNKASDGAGVYIYRYHESAGAISTLTNCTVSANTGPGISITSDGGSGNVDVYLNNSTIAGNTGGGIIASGYASTATTHVKNTVLADNGLASLVQNGSGGSVLTGGGNVASDAAGGLLEPPFDLVNQVVGLAPLGNYGGRTQTQPPRIGSPAINFAQQTGLTSDQRGVPRPIDNALDSGAVELRPLVVTTNADPGDGTCDASCTLRDAIIAANTDGAGVDDISFSAATFGSAQTIDLTGALPLLTSSMNILGSGADRLTVRRSSGGAYRVFTVSVGTKVSLEGMTVTNGNVSDLGGGVYNSGSLTIRDAAISGNVAGTTGGGVFTDGQSLAIERSTISGNQSGIYAGGIGIDNGATTISNTTISGNAAAGLGGAIRMKATGLAANLALVNVTIAGNTATAEGGIGAADYGGPATITLRNTLLAGNTSPNLVTGGANAAIVSEGNNLSSDNGAGFLAGSGDLINQAAQLYELGNFGGTTPTQPPRIGSPALNAGSSAAPATDQRGAPRPQGGMVDIGAVELGPLIVTSAADPGDGVCDASCTLRDAITAANVNGQSVNDITFSPAAFGTVQTINLAGALPTIATELNIFGPGAERLNVHRSSGGNYRIFQMESTSVVNISGLAISNGSDSSGGGVNNLGKLTLTDCSVLGNHATNNGGGVQSRGTLLLSRCTISGNTSSFGAGLFVYSIPSFGSESTIVNSTISGNTATNAGGALENDNFGGPVSDLRLLNCTIADNLHPALGAGVYTGDAGGLAVTRLKNTLLANNTLPNLVEDGAAAVVFSEGANLASDDGSGLLVSPGDQINKQPLLPRWVTTAGILRRRCRSSAVRQSIRATTAARPAWTSAASCGHKVHK